MKTIRSSDHDIYIVNVTIVDDARYIQEDGITNYAYGHPRMAKKHCILTI